MGEWGLEGVCGGGGGGGVRRGRVRGGVLGPAASHRGVISGFHLKEEPGRVEPGSDSLQ